MADDTPLMTSPEPGSRPETTQIAKSVLYISGLGILVVSIVTLGAAAWKGGNELDATARMVFNALLPLFGTWVGTVLAFYFSSKNFESANQSVERMVNLTVEQKLGKLTIDKEMLPADKVTVLRMPAGATDKDLLLKDLRSQLGGKITRLPIVDDKGAVKYILHQSGLYKFIADQALTKGVAQIDKLTLDDLVQDAELKNWIVNIAYAPAGVSVATAKAMMEQRPGCQDLVVTKSGDKSEPMVGWMTNVDIGRLSKA
jgi:hypothetical protein